MHMQHLTLQWYVLRIGACVCQDMNERTATTIGMADDPSGSVAEQEVEYYGTTTFRDGLPHYGIDGSFSDDGVRSRRGDDSDTGSFVDVTTEDIPQNVAGWEESWGDKYGDDPPDAMSGRRRWERSFEAAKAKVRHNARGARGKPGRGWIGGDDTSDVENVHESKEDPLVPLRDVYHPQPSSAAVADCSGGASVPTTPKCCVLVLAEEGPQGDVLVEGSLRSWTSPEEVQGVFVGDMATPPRTDIQFPKFPARVGVVRVLTVQGPSRANVLHALATAAIAGGFTHALVGRTHEVLAQVHDSQSVSRLIPGWETVDVAQVRSNVRFCPRRDVLVRLKAVEFFGDLLPAPIPTGNCTVIAWPEVAVKVLDTEMRLAPEVVGALISLTTKRAKPAMRQIQVGGYISPLGEFAISQLMYTCHLAGRTKDLFDLALVLWNVCQQGEHIRRAMTAEWLVEALVLGCEPFVGRGAPTPYENPEFSTQLMEMVLFTAEYGLRAGCMEGVGLLADHLRARGAPGVSALLAEGALSSRSMLETDRSPGLALPTASMGLKRAVADGLEAAFVDGEGGIHGGLVAVGVTTAKAADLRDILYSDMAFMSAHPMPHKAETAVKTRKRRGDDLQSKFPVEDDPLFAADLTTVRTFLHEEPESLPAKFATHATRVVLLVDGTMVYMLPPWEWIRRGVTPIAAPSEPAPLRWNGSATHVASGKVFGLNDGPLLVHVPASSSPTTHHTSFKLSVQGPFVVFISLQSSDTAMHVSVADDVATSIGTVVMYGGDALGVRCPATLTIPLSQDPAQDTRFLVIGVASVSTVSLLS